MADNTLQERILTILRRERDQCHDALVRTAWVEAIAIVERESRATVVSANPCPICGGGGHVVGPDDLTHRCSECHGTGHKPPEPGAYPQGDEDD